MLLIGGLFVLLMGIFMVAAPEMIYELKESWKSYSAGDPSRLYIISTRIGGVMFILAGIMGIVVFFVS